ncbi:MULTISPECIES: DUF4350 domain-containing protein [unclassified Sphingopyxis]|uniref:DUF4350 domain-containing protein n=1 Tax=unclassified Sphingopyxis TaxID=2614943 RepID=UPI0028650033|nr:MULTISPECIES: DUF4350 domain-containing protein [unclassified Sphingopyxis]MDR6833228.1 hypothetical protein [Sphingopyxis sp. BE122]MDR7225497.1 hypothetical protein [Sphingopyxis sp. BE259]
MSGNAASDGGFNPRLVAGVVAIGIVAFIALWALIALGPQLSSGNDGGGHALSKAAPGYAGIVDLLERSDALVDLRRSEEAPEYDDDWRELLVLTPTHNTKPDDLARLIKGNRGGPILIVLPKWQTGRHPEKAGWSGNAAPISPSPKLLPATVGSIDKIVSEPHARGATATGFVGGRNIALPLRGLRAQVMMSDGFDTMIGFPHGGTLLAKRTRDDVYILSDPDFVNNLAFASRDSARAAAMLVDAVAEDADADGLAFDLTLNGFGSQRSLLRFAFVPPFIGITLCLIAAGLLALWQAWMRFGPALKPARAIAVSKAALIANSADLIKQARRELDGADAYVRSQRSAIARRLHAPGGLDEAATDRWIDKHLRGGSELFSALARRLPLARNTHEFLADAQALHDIRKDLLRDSQ